MVLVCDNVVLGWFNYETKKELYIHTFPVFFTFDNDSLPEIFFLETKSVLQVTEPVGNKQDVCFDSNWTIKISRTILGVITIFILW